METRTQILQASRSIEDSGGISKVAYRIALEFSRRKLSVETFTSEIEKGCEQGIGVVHFITPAPSSVRGIRRYVSVFFWTLRFTGRVHREFVKRGSRSVTISHRDSFGADICVGHSCHRAAIQRKRLEGRRFWFLNPMHLLYLYQEYRIFRRWPYRCLVAISSDIAEEYNRFYGVPEDRIRIIPNGVDLDQFHPDRRNESRIEVSRELSFGENDHILLFVGNEFSRKGLEYVIDALLGLIDTLRDPVRLIVIGKDDPSPFRQQTNDLGLNENVFFLGHRTDAPLFFNASDLFLLPAAYEPFGLVGIEAMAAGVPIVATSTGGIKDYLEDSLNGYVVTRDSGDITEKSLRILQDSDLRDSMSRKARETALQYSWSAIAGQYLDIVEKVAQDKGLNIS